MKHIISILLIATLIGVAPAEDWLMWRKDAGRTDATSSELPNPLQLQWVRTLPTITPALKNPRLHFDAGYETGCCRRSSITIIFLH